ncbi:hypothetical protein ACFXKJ_25495 [Kitasatospora indigofera]|uniref:hypothetical protein n=1 Tax=Kitasatospora indigofera TaxID=67307 RepID=UPI003651B6B9
MNRSPRALRRLRVAAVPLIVVGLGAHLWLGTRTGLVVAAGGFAAHLAAAALGRRWVRRRDDAVPVPHRGR